MRRAAPFVLALLLAAGPASAGPITVKSAPIDYFSASDPGKTAFGPLTFRGGWS